MVKYIKSLFYKFEGNQKLVMVMVCYKVLAYMYHQEYLVEEKFPEEFNTLCDIATQ